MKGKTIKWGIIGCGDVTEVKSGPALRKVQNSEVIAVMRRSEEKVKDYALRHGIKEWYTDAERIIAHPEINAIYVATPPSTHEDYTIRALESGKDVYVEKPMALSMKSCLEMKAVAERCDRKLVVAHYRRFMPYFLKVKSLLESGLIGEVNMVTLKTYQGRNNQVISRGQENWRVDPAISGGGLFHDLAPHQIDMMIYLFGDIKETAGLSVSKQAKAEVADMVSGQIAFENNVLFNGFWAFNSRTEDNTDQCEIFGSKGKLSFGFFGDTRIVLTTTSIETIEVAHPEHVQQPMIEKVVEYFLGSKVDNPCPAQLGVDVLNVVDIFTKQTPL